ncbi:MAG: hypothetical protein IT290_02390 [Deltaproteobacteria bacterium]|nr:hypothetical protein [Deltaproteobacteria bacterium]
MSRQEQKKSVAEAPSPPKTFDEIAQCTSPDVAERLRSGRLPDREEFLRGQPELEVGPRRMKAMSGGSAEAFYLSPSAIRSTVFFDRLADEKIFKRDKETHHIDELLQEADVAKMIGTTKDKNLDVAWLNEKAKEKGVIVLKRRADETTRQHERQHSYFEMNPVVQCAEQEIWNSMPPAHKIFLAAQLAAAGGEQHSYRGMSLDPAEGEGFRLLLSEVSARRVSESNFGIKGTASTELTLEQFRDEVVSLTEENRMTNTKKRRFVSWLADVPAGFVKEVEIRNGALEVTTTNNRLIRAIPEDPTKITGETLKLELWRAKIEP